jgi:hypothetical protein
MVFSEQGNRVGKLDDAGQGGERGCAGRDHVHCVFVTKATEIPAKSSGISFYRPRPKSMNRLLGYADPANLFSSANQ